MSWLHGYALARRAQVGQVVVALVSGVLLLAFFRVQVLASSRYRARSEANRLRPVPIPAPRGSITDRNGVVLAENVPGYSVALLPSSPESLSATLRVIAPVARLSAADIAQIERSYRRAPHQLAVIRREAPFEVVSALEERRVIIPGLVIQAEPKRRYPFGRVAAHLVGYVGEITETELAEARVPGARPGMLLGREGLERAYDDLLRGRDGVRYMEVDALGRTVRDAGVAQTVEPEQGTTIRATIDITLQEYVASVFPTGARGAVVVMHPRTGEILAMYSSPGYDPNAFIGGYDPALWSTLSQSESSPLMNRAIQARYPPASPWKLVVAALAARRGLVDMHTTMPIPCRGGLPYYNRVFRCWRLDGHGTLTLSEAIQYSCDVYFYQLGLKLGLTNLLSEATQLGFRDRSGVDLPGEVQPVFPASTEYYNRRYGPRGWTNAVTLNLAIGQGENAQTLINMTVFYAMLANLDGRAPQPHVVAANGDPGRALELPDHKLGALREALVQVVQRGTASAARIADLRIAGKTGTAENPHGADHGWFLAFAPADEPQLVVGAVIEFAQHGSLIAPMVNRIIARYLLGAGALPAIDDYQLILPSDSAPDPVPILPDSVPWVGRE